MLRFLDAGESHGIGLAAILEGLPSNFDIDMASINRELARRQKGYGRSERMAIEQDTARVLSGLHKNRTTGNPVTILIENKDHENWRKLSEEQTRVTIPRPGHADLTGLFKYRTGDMRDSIERSSARETTTRVAVGALCKEVLKVLGVEVRSRVHALHDLTDGYADLFDDQVYSVIEKSELRVFHKEEEMKALVDKYRDMGDTIGGWVHVEVRGCPKGVGSFTQYDRKLDGRIALGVMNVQGIKQVSIGNPFNPYTGSSYHDGIMYDDGHIVRASNHAGGIEGGITNGENIVVYAYMKPIPSLKMRIGSIDLDTRTNTDSRYERSDVTAVAPVSVVVENVLAFEILREILETFAGDNKEELMNSLKFREDRIGEL